MSVWLLWTIRAASVNPQGSRLGEFWKYRVVITGLSAALRTALCASSL
ncbi:hypothetical protein LOK82_13890 [Xylella fastidiosa subsp. multiplex]|uniref:Uncharacterized protein n=1 Tax=Xylella fastidiosa subsp. multiplex TaxID=644357 RepID=A0AAW6I255_XYLFS|nr:hypothetical protein [Xylella fastidiosa subsp. multiplex]